jgi:hypothetical protein
MVLASEGFLTYVFIPMAIMKGDKWLSNFLMLTIFSNNIIGMAILIQVALPPLARFVIKSYCLFQKLIVRNNKPYQF